MKNFNDEIELIRKLDQLKSVIRNSDTLDGSKKESSAEHSWQCAQIALLLGKHRECEIDIQKVLTMLIVHDTGEIGAGDISIYNDYDKAEYNKRELNCVYSLFNKFNPELVEVWKEFEKGESLEAKFAKAVDRISGILSSHFNMKSCWSEEGMTVDKILKRNIDIKEGFPEFWPYFEQLVMQANQDGKIGLEVNAM